MARSFTDKQFYSVTQLAKWANKKTQVDGPKRIKQRKFLETQGYGFDISASGWELSHDGKHVAYNQTGKQTRPLILLEQAVVAAWKHRKENK